MTTVQAEKTRRFTPAEFAAMRARGIIGLDERVELRDGRLTVDGHLRPISPYEAIAMVETGVLEPDERVELIEGELRIVSPQGWSHRRVVMELTEILVLAYRGVGKVGVQSSLRMSGSSLPEPDLMVLRGDHAGLEADDAILVVEAAVTSHSHDRRKARIYAEAGVPELWMIDVPARTLTVHTDPRRDGSWGTAREVGEDEPLALPEDAGSLTLRRVLPPG